MSLQCDFLGVGEELGSEYFGVGGGDFELEVGQWPGEDSTMLVEQIKLGISQGLGCQCKEAVLASDHGARDRDDFHSNDLGKAVFPDDFDDGLSVLAATFHSVVLVSQSQCFSDHCEFVVVREGVPAQWWDEHRVGAQLFSLDDCGQWL